MTKPDDAEAALLKMLEGQFSVGTLTRADIMQQLEQYRAARAQGRAANYAWYSALAALASAVISVASLVISVIALTAHRG